ncbi:MAG: succinylglutamate desuccinylase/aspartoacylase family protein [Chloroflexi bacterium]|nr:succinylglutamate desuccinylase/aspartoacylase family protein [Chloroflexota bacterium]
MILVSVAACQPTIVPTATATVPPATPLAQASPRPTQTPRPILQPTDTPLIPTIGANRRFAPTGVTLIPIIPTPVLLAAAPALPPQAFRVGQSAAGRDILGWRIGTGERVLLLVGGIHAGYEANTVMLVRELIDHFQRAPADVLPGITLILVPVANPDGLERGRVAEGRFNGNGVDLNRNWGCEWSAEAYWKSNRVNPGSQPFSEPETRALAALVGEVRPAAAVFYHSAAHGVFAGDCQPGGGVSGTLAAVLGEAAGYPYGEPFSAYQVSGTAPNWLDGQGIPAVDVELTGTRDSEFIPNLRGVMAVQRWLTGGLDAGR